MTSLSAELPGSPQSRGEWLRMQRQARGWSVPEMRRYLRKAARERGDKLPADDCLGVMIRRWEKDVGGVSERYRMYYCLAFSIPLDVFGIAPPPDGAVLVTALAPPPPLDEDERAELTRLRSQHAELAARHRQFTRDLMTWVCKAMDEDTRLAGPGVGRLPQPAAIRQAWPRRRVPPSGGLARRSTVRQASGEVGRRRRGCRGARVEQRHAYLRRKVRLQARRAGLRARR